ncbi:hypothetical protein HK100_009733 [Physocladia obscura]|uniref:Uncharacterized protein n=1 Tax=Physocladia obscura TaxID=109957 RepID=A0AAD5TAP2_9FUNG|nr:hypothetical protein HK100_009733 [Physocladia obscura]
MTRGSHKQPPTSNSGRTQYFEQKKLLRKIIQPALAASYEPEVPAANLIKIRSEACNWRICKLENSQNFFSRFKSKPQGSMRQLQSPEAVLTDAFILLDLETSSSTSSSTSLDSTSTLVNRVSSAKLYRDKHSNWEIMNHCGENVAQHRKSASFVNPSVWVSGYSPPLLSAPPPTPVSCNNLMRKVSFAPFDDDPDDYFDSEQYVASLRRKESASINFLYCKGILKSDSHICDSLDELLNFYGPSGEEPQVFGLGMDLGFPVSRKGERSLKNEFEMIKKGTMLDRIRIKTRFWIIRKLDETPCKSVANPIILQSNDSDDEDDLHYITEFEISRSTTSLVTVLENLTARAEQFVSNPKILQIRVQSRDKKKWKAIEFDEIEWRIRIGEVCGEDEMLLFADVGSEKNKKHDNIF